MKEKPNYISGYHKADDNSLWKWKGIKSFNKKNEEKRISITDFFEESGRKLEEAVVGPGAGAGAGCGVGVGFGLVGGFGVGGSPWNQLKMVFGVGMGCGVGLGFGYGQGIGFGSSLDSLKSRLLPQSPKSKKRVVIAI